MNVKIMIVQKPRHSFGCWRRAIHVDSKVRMLHETIAAIFHFILCKKPPSVPNQPEKQSLMMGSRIIGPKMAKAMPSIEANFSSVSFFMICLWLEDYRVIQCSNCHAPNEG